ncbi:DUF5684 domain-containing protein [Haloarcula laminariae]|uniref:DUF5684 domain-containing protein n=1 Tax=Haloarcula laminariae TaxID=2961577 RepID=UPI0021C88C9E|nr:DUF5684 domain-containing protein [Halomicroarcula laminariae]
MVTGLLSLLSASAIPLQNDMAGAIFGLIFFGLYALVIVAIIGGMWKTFAKAGEPGWGALIPIYNTYLLLKIAGRPGWWLVLYLIPVINFIIVILVSIDIADNFGKGVGYGIGIAFLPFLFYPLLGFGDATYKGSSTGGF